MSDGRTEISVAYAMLAATKQKGCAECGVALCAHVAEVISVLHKTAPAERAILTDLIAELRACPVLPATREDLEPLRNMADRAEERLRQITEGDA